MRMSRGSIVLEAAILFPLLISLIMSMLAFALLTYEKIHLRAVADTISMRTAALFSNEIIESEDLTIEQLLRGVPKGTDPNIIDIFAGRFNSSFGSLGSQTEANLTKIAKDMVVDGSILKNASEVEVEVKSSGTVFKSIEVNIVCEYEYPFAAAWRFLGYEGNYKIAVTSKAPISDQTELVRLIDLVVDFIPGFGVYQAKIDNIASKFEETINGFR